MLILMEKKRLYVDMDGVLVDFVSGVESVDPETRERYPSHPEDIPGIFARMAPMPGAVDALGRLRERFDVYILSTAPWDNPSAWSDKLEWVKRHLDPYFTKRLILCHHKDLLNGACLIDDRPNHGADRFPGEWIHFGTPEFPDWKAVLDYLCD